MEVTEDEGGDLAAAGRGGRSRPVLVQVEVTDGEPTLCCTSG